MPDSMTIPKRKNASRADVGKSVMAILLDDEPKPTGAVPATPKTLNISNLVSFANHPFKPYEGDRLDDMIRSVRELGILLPVIVRPLSDNDETYEILSGHNRVNAAKIAGLTEVPVIIKDGLTDDEAKLIVTETNLVQRSFADLSHSERAIALKTHMEAISNQGKRNDLIDEIKRLSNPHKINEDGTCDPLGHRLKSREQTAQTYDLSPTNVARYLRVALLNSSLLDRVNINEIAIRPAVSLSYLSSTEQEILNRLLDETQHKVDMKKAETLRTFSESGKLTDDKIQLILSGELGGKPKSKTAPPLKIKAKVYQKHFVGDYTRNQMESIIDLALTEYFQNHQPSNA